MFKRQKLQNSSSRIYQVYALIDPRDNLAHYVGISVDAESRFYGHAHEVTGNYGESRWIKNLKKNGLSPILQILEEIDGDNAGAIACEKEQYWISEMLRLGHPLLTYLVTRALMSEQVQENCTEHLRNRAFLVMIRELTLLISYRLFPKMKNC